MVVVIVIFAVVTGDILESIINDWINKRTADNIINETEISPTPDNRQKYKVTKIIDGDTIEIENGQKVRYIGMDTPETVDPRRPIQCYGIEASNKNKELVLDKEVYLEKDVSETDRYGRLLRYVWVNEVMINKLLVEEGYARAATFPPDVKYAEIFLQTQEKARKELKGLWGNQCK